MAEPSPKRRRTSAEPPVVTENGDFRPRNALRRTPPRRASFLSPTRASLARFNPEVLSRRASAASAAPEPDEPSQPPSRGQRALSYVLGESQQNPGLPSEGNNAAAAPQQDGGDQRRRSIGGRLLPTRDVLQAAAADQLAQESVAQAEDDLPTYPTGSPAARPDLPPEQALFSSPSKKARRNKSLGQRLSSPFKPRELPLRPEPAEQDLDAGAGNMRLAERRQVEESTQGVDSTAFESRPPPDVPKVEDDSKEKQKQKDRLQKQLQEMQEEIRQYEQEIERNRTASGEDSAEDMSALVSLITKANPPPSSLKPEAPSLSSLLSAFLPLAKPIRPPTPPLEEPEEALPSHAPIELENPLPYLRFITTFEYDSRIDVGEEIGHQIHSISIRSPDSLLHLELKLSANPATQSVTKLEIASLSPWASHDLGAWIKLRAAENDIGAVCWATESYYDVAVKRAKCWAKCYRKFGHLLDHGPPVQDGRGSGKRTVQRVGTHQEVPTSSNLLEEETEEVSGIGNDVAVGDQEDRRIKRLELMYGLGRERINLRSRQVLFKVSWKIRFDWTGEAESVVGADVALPGVWREADDRGSLRKIPATFDKLVGEMGVFEATKTMVGLLFAE
ncbi:uncharacterized protein BKCO1_2000113 [Diplodia corticola]|uniref:Uncharacterized protein n=1 Tax=Diplodia corticola TaxID=236234 RepID=A0A1J9RGQ7_9PEZI|nr:uncharacterized protein BKCO1_2000113 [Diplodia corticola]OJD39776.1 hypothetical protein BKCO1_2000113 [Diplodia corticola]